MMKKYEKNKSAYPPLFIRTKDLTSVRKLLPPSQILYTQWAPNSSAGIHDVTRKIRPNYPRIRLIIIIM